jgi:hypothetical protein
VAADDARRRRRSVVFSVVVALPTMHSIYSSLMMRWRWRRQPAARAPWNNTTAHSTAAHYWHSCCVCALQCRVRGGWAAAATTAEAAAAAARRLLLHYSIGIPMSIMAIAILSRSEPCLMAASAAGTHDLHRSHANPTRSSCAYREVVRVECPVLWRIMIVGPQ